MNLNNFNNFNKNGFAVFKDPVLNKDQITASLLGVKRVMAGHYNTGTSPWAEVDVNNSRKLQRITQIHWADETLFALVTDSRIGKLAAQITGAKTIKIWGSQLYYKPAGSGNDGVVGFHRDSQHMPYFAAGMLTVWLPLPDLPVKSGPLTVVEGSHLWPQHSQSCGAQRQDMTQQRHALQGEYPNQIWQEHQAVIPAGAISFHHQDVLHGSPANTSNEARCVLAFGLITNEARFNDDVEDYGIGEQLKDQSRCPFIYKHTDS